MTDTHKFKIEMRDSSYCPFSLMVRKPRWHTWLTGIWRWHEVYADVTKEAVRKRYEEIKDLPEYL